MSVPNNAVDGHLSLSPKRCPTCKTIIRAAFRYGNFIKPQLRIIDLAKKKFEKERSKLDEKVKKEILAAMEKDLGANSSGKWFYCPDGHPYAIGECGGASQVSVVKKVLKIVILFVVVY
jgi:hypothetical protein